MRRHSVRERGEYAADGEGSGGRPSLRGTPSGRHLLGLSSRLRLLVVVHCCRESESIIRIIPARKADKRERGDYLSRNSP